MIQFDLYFSDGLKPPPVRRPRHGRGHKDCGGDMGAVGYPKGGPLLKVMSDE